MKALIPPLVCATLLAVAGSAMAQTEAAATPAMAAAGPQDYDQQFQAARSLALGGHREQALHAYSDLLRRSPANPDVLLGRGQVYAWMGRWRESEADLLAAAAVAPTYADIWTALGNMYLWSDRPTQAVAAFGRWLDLRPADPAPRLARGRAYRAAGDKLAARADFEAAAGLGAEAALVAGYLGSLTPHVQNPEAVVPAGYRWSASLAADATGFSRGQSTWSDYSMSLRRHFEHGSLALELLGARRFGLSDQAWALDGYLDLWHRGYVNLRVQQGPQANLFPGHSMRAELFQGLGRGWELSASYDRLEFTDSAVNMYGFGVGRYVGNFYLRARRLYVPGAQSHSVSDRLLLRYYYAGDGDNYLEFKAGAGRSDDDIADTRARGRSASLAYVRYPGPHWGFKVGAELSREADVDGHGVFMAVYRRW